MSVHWWKFYLQFPNKFRLCQALYFSLTWIVQACIRLDGCSAGHVIHCRKSFIPRKNLLCALICFSVFQKHIGVNHQMVNLLQNSRFSKWHKSKALAFDQWVKISKLGMLLYTTRKLCTQNIKFLLFHLCILDTVIVV